VEEVVKSIGLVQAQAQVMREDMGALGKQADGIGAIMNVISDIADQTNLLALNAAIEAARAGDAGRGFAVVADEVRKLAEKTMTATKEVGQAISGIQQGTTQNIGHVNESVRAVEQATALANKSGEALREIVHLVDSASDQVRSIATASEEQSAASEQISRSIGEVNIISAETTQAMTQAAQAVGELANQAHTLRNLIGELEDEGGGSLSH
jgi:methyl-accepting chemotaxis protein